MQARGPDALSLGRETGVTQAKATAELFCWMLKVLGRKREPGCLCVSQPSQTRTDGESRDLDGTGVKGDVGDPLWRSSC